MNPFDTDNLLFTYLYVEPTPFEQIKHFTPEQHKQNITKECDTFIDYAFQDFISNQLSIINDKLSSNSRDPLLLRTMQQYKRVNKLRQPIPHFTANIYLDKELLESISTMINTDYGKAKIDYKTATNKELLDKKIVKQLIDEFPDYKHSITELANDKDQLEIDNEYVIYAILYFNDIVVLTLN